MYTRLSTLGSDSLAMMCFANNTCGQLSITSIDLLEGVIGLRSEVHYREVVRSLFDTL
jgi:hypothetical protein